MVRKPELRRVPQQTRGELRLAKILDAGEKVFAQVGYEAATTNAIARQAKTSIGSLYQFFPNKEAILEAVAGRYLERLRAVLDDVLTDEVAYLPLLVVYERIIAALAEFHAANPGFRHLFYGSTTSAHLAAEAAALGACSVERHITMDRAMWGSDHAASLEPNGISRLVRDIRLWEQAKGDGIKRVYEREFPIIKKLRRVGATV